jgi:hypothetical protein
MGTRGGRAGENETGGKEENSPEKEAVLFAVQKRPPV